MLKILKSLIIATTLGAAPLAVLTPTIASAADAITTKSVNFRAGPGTNYAIRGQIPSGQLINVQNCSGNWCSITYGAFSGFASINYIAFKNGASTYNSYNRPQSSFNIIITPGRDHFYNGHYRPRPPLFGSGHRPPPHWGNRPPPPPHWGNRPPPPPPHGGNWHR